MPADYREDDLVEARALVPSASSKQQERIALALADRERLGRHRVIARLREVADWHETAERTEQARALRDAIAALATWPPRLRVIEGEQEVQRG